jgi:hypothetical protein
MCISKPAINFSGLNKLVQAQKAGKSTKSSQKRQSSKVTYFLPKAGFGCCKERPKT